MIGPFGYISDEHTLTSNYIRDHSVGIWQEKDGTNPFVGSGICIEIVSRLFIATCAHNFQDIPSGGSYRLFSANGSSQDPVKVIAYDYGQFGADDTLDVAWLEVDPQSAAERKLSGIPLDYIEPYHSAPIETRYFFAGLPFEVGVKWRTEDHEHYVINFGIFVTTSIEKPKNKIKNILDDSIFLSHQEEGYTNQGLKQMPHPRGVSGGGLWHFFPRDSSQVWAAAKYPLVGIVSHFVNKYRLVSAIRMHHWLTFLLATHPEFKDVLEAKLTPEQE